MKGLRDNPIVDMLIINRIPSYFIRFGTITIFVVAFTLQISAQPKKFRMTGFAEYLNNTWVPEKQINSQLKIFGRDGWQNQSGVYNRFNFWYTPVKQLEFYVGMRNNFSFGPTITTYNKILSTFGFDYNELATFDNGFMDLTFLYADDDSYVFYTNFDRANVKLTLNKFELTVGRQRINWGANFVWNPNDIFNAYNYFDFNYVERPGSDAVLMEIFTGDFSSVQLAGKLSHVQVLGDSNKLEKVQKLTAAAMYKFNKWNYDFQFFSGVMEDDVTAGMGWAGSIAGAGFTGEATWFRNQKHFSDSSNIFVASIAVNYTFKNSLFINFSGIYNSDGATGPANKGFGNLIGSPSSLFSTNLNAKTLTRSRFDVFGEVSYPATPLINVDLASIFNPCDKSVFIGPSVTFSISDNISLMLVGQLFWGDPETEFGDIGQMYFLDLKWSF